MVDQRDDIIELTDAEAELYDRQIRLWGLESQKRLRSANILLAGLNGFIAEVAKNIILAGVKSVTFLDHRDLRIEDTCSQFLAPKTQLGKNRAEASLQKAQNLNPMVVVSADTEKIDDKPDSFFKNFDVVCVSECTITQIQRINAACRKYNVKFFVGDVWGSFGYTFADLGTHEFVEDVVQSKKMQVSEGGEPGGKGKFENIVTTVKRTIKFTPFDNILNAQKLPKESETYYLLRIMLNYREKYGTDPLPSERDNENLKNEVTAIIEKYNLCDSINNLVTGDLYAQISPVCAIVGGVMGQEIIKTVSQKEAPHNNLFLFNPDTMCGKILNLGKK
ncbi:SUMO-activating enzyme subunit 1 [Cephus cinctus]|uniref:SUMO-activating enzyme subunit 1 n=1 Tax=Cephus cinctus TaxID=211228 RepID=A0AAJ7CFL0_CEPCN|nr:SUMO-activating enzyme subunit 1 [Cephus cinctus]